MNSNPGIQNNASIAWDGTNAFAKDITKHRNFGWAFEVTGVIAADAVFKVQAAPPSAGDKCVPGTFADVQAITICQAPVTPGTLATFTVPAGTPVGTLCAGTIPCRPNTFVRLASVSGTVANVKAVLIRQGPMS